MGALTGKNALVTGGGSGIGLACAAAFARDGANVLIMGRNAEKLQAAAESLADAAGEITTFAGSVSDEGDVAAAVAAASQTGGLHIAVANAGTGGLSPIMATDAENWDEIMQTNLNGTFYTVKHAGRAMAQVGGGAICAISSIAGVRTHRFMGPYCVSKAGRMIRSPKSAEPIVAQAIEANRK